MVENGDLASQEQRQLATQKRNQNPRVVDSGKVSAANRSDSSPSPPPPAPIATKRRPFVALVDEEDEEEVVDLDLKRAEKRKNGGEEEIGVKKRRTRRLSRKLGDDFDRVAAESELGKSSSDSCTDSVMSKLNSNGKQLKGGEKAKRVSENRASPSRTSPRLAKRRLS